MHRAVLCVLVAAFFAAACSDGERATGSSASSTASVGASAFDVSTEPSAAVAPSLDGAAVLEKFQCNRCHDNAPRVAPDKHCLGCHEQIVDGSFKLASAADVRAWRPHVKSLRFAPSLSGVGSLVSEAWVKAYLRAPFDLRPHLHPEMPRLAISQAEAEALVRTLATQNAAHVANRTEDASLGDAEKGRTLFVEKACGSCHHFSGAGLAEPGAVREDADAANVLAPDLRFSRERLVPSAIVQYLIDPRSIKKGAAMPKQNLTGPDARDLAAFVLTTPLREVAPAARFRRLPVLDRAVGWDEVAARTFRKICWHCHSQPDYARGDGGPGNTGGFGFAARGLDLSSYESMSAGIIGRDGERQSVFAVGPTGLPLLLEALLSRHEEAYGQPGRVRGMPLGLPALGAEDLQLVETWIAQGHPR